MATRAQLRRQRDYWKALFESEAAAHFYDIAAWKAEVEALRKDLEECQGPAPPPPAPSKWASITDGAPDVQDPNSQKMIDRLLAGGNPPTSAPENRANFGIPVYYALPSDGIYQISTNHGDYDSNEQDGRLVRCPAEARPNQGSDSVFWIVDRQANEVNQFQRCEPYGGVDHDARIINCWKSFRFHLDTGWTVNLTGAPTGIPPISPDELLAGYVDHPISMGVSKLTPGPVAPFEDSGTQGHSGGPDDLHMGSHVKLAPTAVADAGDRNAPAHQLAVLRGIRDHGMIVGLNSGSPWAIKYESSQTADYTGLPATMRPFEGVDLRNELYVVAPWPRP